MQIASSWVPEEDVDPYLTGGALGRFVGPAFSLLPGVLGGGRGLTMGCCCGC